jgi:hypothetical protein
LDAIVWVFGIAMGILLISSIAPNLLVRLGGKIKEGGTVESSRQARKIVTLEDVTKRKFYTVTNREDRGGDKHHLTLLNLDTRTIEYENDVTVERLKFNPFEIMDTGFVNIRLLPIETTVETVTPNYTSEDQHTQYTKEELQDMSVANYRKLQIAESEINELKTNARKDMDDTVDHVGSLLRQAKQQTPKK